MRTLSAVWSATLWSIINLNRFVEGLTTDFGLISLNNNLICFCYNYQLRSIVAAVEAADSFSKAQAAQQTSWEHQLETCEHALCLIQEENAPQLATKCSSHTFRGFLVSSVLPIYLLLKLIFVKCFIYSFSTGQVPIVRRCRVALALSDLRCARLLAQEL